ncbi:MAG: YkgJ family cysteine cluster protein [Candidatus Omnitrophica bacterium]|jgi:hypothetical protein|nr:YkgJ family cysteine cluster protein [Candidatus Omnitrophota bacterium]
MKLKQIVPESFCLKCQGCCRFRQANSPWLPCLMHEEIQDLLDRKIPPVSISIDRKIQPVFDPQSEMYLCALLDKPSNKCKIYGFHPFECQLYPFLINLRQDKAIITVDMNCPYVEKSAHTQEFRDYVKYLTEFLNAPEQIKLIKNNPQNLEAYEELAKVIELNLPDEAA